MVVVGGGGAEARGRRAAGVTLLVLLGDKGVCVRRLSMCVFACWVGGHMIVSSIQLRWCSYCTAVCLVSCV